MGPGKGLEVGILLFGKLWLTQMLPHHIEDSVTWTLNANGSFTVSSAWQALRSKGPEVVWFKME